MTGWPGRTDEGDDEDEDGIRDAETAFGVVLLLILFMFLVLLGMVIKVMLGW